MLSVFLCFSLYSKAQINSFPKAQKDTISGLYGYIDSTGNYIIDPQFSFARNFVSPYAAIEKDSLWGVIGLKGNYILKPQYTSQLSAVYKNRFIKYGENMELISLDGNIQLSYLFVPGPFEEIERIRNAINYREDGDANLINHILNMGAERLCHYYKINRLYNGLAFENDQIAIKTIVFILENPEKVETWIEKDKDFERAYEKGEVGCCGQGAVWYGE